ncbi:hypothetical protein KOW79_010601 [Hemibagrus wyckioides]|uniref:Uncharacterized protein n=1 Tax=Hemibagrus wyckioides TaxID=337641 RepID=A0A9D3NLB1_9TELE|nr:uncharacterized protein LOC131362803 [Hemibagrus wyckioides]KAG7325676.1 hypothetical protein KOW79_010601 [Hemibagrus wyckioides]
MEARTNARSRGRRKPVQNYVIYKEKNKQNVLSCACSLITHTMQMTKGNNNLLVYMDEMLHSIFFLGYIHYPRLAPERFFQKPETIKNLRNMFPGPFEQYRSHLPTRTPFSILLDMMKIIHQTEERIIAELVILLNNLKFPIPLHKSGNIYEQFYTLESTVICVCYSDSDPERYYGASLCCRKGNSKTIMIDVSCLRTWHDLVSHAVMSFCSGGRGDGITFPKSVKCQAYIRGSNGYTEKRPCSKCHQLFNLNNADQNEAKHPYGNCAEAECFSKLLMENQQIRENTRIDNHTEEKLQNLRRSTKARLIKQLQNVGIQINNDFHFYSTNTHG